MNTEGFDKFYTPQNHFFYSQAPYTPLDSRRSQIRVIRVFPRASIQEHFRNHVEWDRSYVKELDPERQLLACQIETTALASIAGVYSTISYSAGDLSDTELILVNGIPFNAFANLEHAIECVLTHWPRTGHKKPSSTYKLWTDQICINQSDKKELGEQVQFMREIYRQSEQTFVCLSTPKIWDCLSWIPRVTEASNAVPQSGNTPGVDVLKHLLLDLLVGVGEGGALRPSLLQLPTRRKSDSPGRQIGASHDSLRRAITVDGTPSRAFPLSQGHTISVLRVGLDSFDDQAEIVGRGSLPSADVFQNSLENFMTNKWWRRSWVYQEFISGRSIQFVSGPTSVPWTELAPLVNFVCDDLNDFVEQIRDYFDLKITEEVKGKEDERKAEVQRRKREEERDRRESELRRRQNEEIKKMEREERRRKEVEDMNRRYSEQARSQRIIHAEKEAEKRYQQRLQEYHSQQLAFDIERKRQWDTARKKQSDQREKYVADERFKVQEELNDVKSRKAATKPSQLRQKWELHQEEKALLNFWKEVAKPIEEQIKGAWSFRKDKMHDQELKINNECGGRLFSKDRIEALISLDLIANTPVEFTPIGAEQPVRPRKPIPAQRAEAGGERRYTSRRTVAAGSVMPGSPPGEEDMQKILAQPRRRPYLAPFPPPQAVSRFSYLREDYDNEFDDEKHATNHISTQGHPAARGNNTAGEDEASMEFSFDKLCPFEIRQRRSIASFQAKFREVDQSAIRSMIKGKQGFKRSSDLKSLLQHSRNCQASDARDRVYAFLGLADPEYDIVPNYAVENSVREVLIETAKGIIRFDKSLDILQHVHRGRDKLGFRLPSWVPDWTSEETQTGLDNHSHEEANSFNASKGLPAYVQFSSATGDEDHQDLKVRGIFLDKIEETTSESADIDGLSSFFTINDNLGVIGPRSARTDDEVWVLYGSKKPVVLRRNDKAGNVYGYLGDVLVYNKDASFSTVMFGDMVEKMQQGTLNADREREFWII